MRALLSLSSLLRKTVFIHSCVSSLIIIKLKYFNKPTSKKSHMLSALRSAFTENTRSSVGLNDLGAAAAAEEEASLGEDGARIVGERPLYRGRGRT